MQRDLGFRVCLAPQLPLATQSIKTCRRDVRRWLRESWPAARDSFATHRLHRSSFWEFWELPYRILNISHKKELEWSLRVISSSQDGAGARILVDLNSRLELAISTVARKLSKYEGRL